MILFAEQIRAVKRVDCTAHGSLGNKRQKPNKSKSIVGHCLQRSYKKFILGSQNTVSKHNKPTQVPIVL